jgi:hypothetical protein
MYLLPMRCMVLIPAFLHVETSDQLAAIPPPPFPDEFSRKWVAAQPRWASSASPLADELFNAPTRTAKHQPVTAEGDYM